MGQVIILPQYWSVMTTVKVDKVIILQYYWSLMTTVKMDKVIILPQYWSVDYGQDGQSVRTTILLVCGDYVQVQRDPTAITLVC